MKLKAVTSWFADTPKRALEQAYQAALTVKEIEERYFSGQKIVRGSSQHSDRVVGYFQAEIKKYLKIVKIRLKEFQSSRSLFTFSQISLNKSDLDNLPTDFIDKLETIEQILNKYSPASQLERTVSQPQKNNASLAPGSIAKVETVSDKTSLLPRSFLRTIDRIKEDITPETPETDIRVLQKYRQSRQKTIIACRFLLTLLLVPYLTYLTSKTFLVKPIIEARFIEKEGIFFINEELEESAFQELEHFEEKLHFKSLIGTAPEISPAETEIKLQEKVAEIIARYRQRSIDAIANIFADLFSLVSFAIVIATSQREIAILKSFLDSIIYGLSDSAKAFLIILLTDMFVGFHSPHGWEIILEGMARHLGLPESREFIFLFIATFPVILDTIFKYWIFRYLNRISPSSVATYRDMNK